MLIKEVQIDKIIERKIYKKHGVIFYEVKNGLLSNPYVKKTKDDRYIAITTFSIFITVIFTYENRIVDIITAYPSSKWQIKLFKNKKEGK